MGRPRPGTSCVLAASAPPGQASARQRRTRACTECLLVASAALTTASPLFPFEGWGNRPSLVISVPKQLGFDSRKSVASDTPARGTSVHRRNTEHRHWSLSVRRTWGQRWLCARRHGRIPSPSLSLMRTPPDPLPAL